MFKKILSAGLLVLAVIGFVAPDTADAAPTTGDYCVVHVTGQKASGELTTSSPRCYDTLARSMQAEGVRAYGEGASVKAAQLGLASFTIGLHCDGFSLGAPCTSVVGTGCTGGWLNTSAAWNNRISSTQHGCPTIYHFDGANLTGAFAVTFAPGPNNLSLFNNRTSSIQYT